MIKFIFDIAWFLATDIVLNGLMGVVLALFAHLLASFISLPYRNYLDQNENNPFNSKLTVMTFACMGIIYGFIDDHITNMEIDRIKAYQGEAEFELDLAFEDYEKDYPICPTKPIKPYCYRTLYNFHKKP